jgi:colanic acid biosynthesis glycosyl transferase WcaI
MRVLFVNQIFFPDEASVSQHLTDLAEDMVAAGHHVHVLAGRNDYEQPDRLYSRREVYKKIFIRRISSTSFSKKYIAGRIVNTAVFNVNLFLRLLFLDRKLYQCMICSTVPPMIAFAASIAAWLHRIPFVYWIMDLQPDEAISAGVLRAGSPAAAIISWFGKLPLAKASLVIVLDRFMESRIAARGVPSEKIIVTLPWAVNAIAAPSPRSENPFRIKYGFADRFVIMYSGNHSICHPLDTLLGACKALRDDARFLFVFIGNGVRTRDVREFKTRQSLDNIIQLPHQPRASLHFSLTAADLHIVVMGDPFVGIVHPCKIYSIMDLGLPFVAIGPAPSHLTDIVEASGVGFTVCHNDIGGCANAIQNAAQLTEAQNKQWHEKAHSYSRTYFTRRAVLPFLVRRIEEAVEKCGH